MFHDRKPCRAKQRLHDVLVHASRRAEHARAHIWNVCKFEQPLNCSVLPKRPVQDGENNVHIDGAISSASGRRIGLKWCQPGPRFMRLRWNHHGFAILQHCRGGGRFGISSAQLRLWGVGLCGADLP